jgi:transcriptional regulator with XRE-family HTH domain
MTEMLSTHTDKTLLAEMGHRIARLRVEAGMTQAGLAYEAGISKSTVERLEAGRSIQLAGLLRVLRVLQLIGHLDRLLPEPVQGPIALLDGEKAVRRRPPRKKKPDAEAVPWRWGDQ